MSPARGKHRAAAGRPDSMLSCDSLTTPQTFLHSPSPPNSPKTDDEDIGGAGRRSPVNVRFDSPTVSTRLTGNYLRLQNASSIFTSPERAQSTSLKFRVLHSNPSELSHTQVSRTASAATSLLPRVIPLVMYEERLPPSERSLAASDEGGKANVRNGSSNERTFAVRDEQTGMARTVLHQRSTPNIASEVHDTTGQEEVPPLPRVPGRTKGLRPMRSMRTFVEHSKHAHQHGPPGDGEFLASRIKGFMTKDKAAGMTPIKGIRPIKSIRNFVKESLDAHRHGPQGEGELVVEAVKGLVNKRAMEKAAKQAQESDKAEAAVMSGPRSEARDNFSMGGPKQPIESDGDAVWSSVKNWFRNRRAARKEKVADGRAAQAAKYPSNRLSLPGPYPIQPPFIPLERSPTMENPSEKDFVQTPETPYSISSYYDDNPSTSFPPETRQRGLGISIESRAEQAVTSHSTASWDQFSERMASPLLPPPMPPFAVPLQSTQHQSQTRLRTPAYISSPAIPSPTGTQVTRWSDFTRDKLIRRIEDGEKKDRVSGFIQMQAPPPPALPGFFDTATRRLSKSIIEQKFFTGRSAKIEEGVGSEAPKDRKLPPRNSNRKKLQIHISKMPKVPAIIAVGSKPRQDSDISFGCQGIDSPTRRLRSTRLPNKA